jgi:DnaJ-class molecular chaperone
MAAFTLSGRALWCSEVAVLWREDQVQEVVRMVVNKHTHTATPLDTYIGRGSFWGNRFSHREGTKAEFVVGSLAEAVEAHRVDLWARVKSGEVTLEQLASLRGRTLVCFCSEPSRPRPCHGHTLEKAARWASDLLAKQSGACRTCLGSGRVRSTALAAPGAVWTAQPCPTCSSGS